MRRRKKARTKVSSIVFGGLGKNGEFWFPIILMVSGLTPLIWLRDGLIIAGADVGIFLNPARYFANSWYLWNPQLSGGYPDWHTTSVFPFLFFYKVLSYLPFSLINIQRLWFIFQFALPGFSMYYLMSVVTKSRARSVAKLIASLFYMFNLYVVIIVTAFPQFLAYGLMPLLLGLYIKGLNEKGKNSSRYIALFGIVSIFLYTSYSNPAMVGIIWIVILSYLVYYVSFKRQIFHALWFSLRLVAVYVLSSLPALFSLAYVYRWMGTLYGNIPGFYAAPQGGARLLDSFRLLGFWGWNAGVSGEPYYPFARYYSYPLLTIATFCLAVLVFSSLLFSKKLEAIHYFALLGILGLFLAKGSIDPLGSVYTFLFRHVPGFPIFRDAYAKFTAINALAFAALAGFAASGLYEWLSRFRSKRGRPLLSKMCGMSVVLVGLLIFSVSWPLLTGGVWPRGGARKILAGYHVQVPSYWINAARWIEDKGDFRLFELPQNTSYMLKYNWKYDYGGTDPALPLINKNLIATTIPNAPPPLTTRLAETTYQRFNSGSSSNLASFLGLFNVRYIVQRNDLDYKYAKAHSPAHIRLLLRKQKGITFSQKFGKLDFYKVGDEYFLPHIYSPKNITYLEGGIKDFEVLTSLGDYRPSNGIFFSNLRKRQGSSALRKASDIFVKAVPVDRKGTHGGYSLEVPETLDYEVFLGINRAEDLDKLSVSLKLDNKISNFKEVEVRRDGWVRLGRAKVRKGRHILRMETFGNEAGSLLGVADIVFRASKSEVASPKITFKEINPTKYAVSAYGARGPFLLVFSESFHPGWRAYVRQVKDHGSAGKEKKAPEGIKGSPIWETWFKEPLSKSKHFLVNGYANSWWVSGEKEGKNSEDYEIILEFWPQRMFYLSLFISGLTLLFCIGYLIFDWKEEKQLNRFAEADI